jgi:hypothetical protein
MFLVIIHRSARRSPPRGRFAFGGAVMRPSFKLDDRHKFQKMLDQLADRDGRIAATWALNDTAKEVRDLIPTHMDKVFDRPKPWTKNAFHFRGARPDHLEVTLERKDAQSRRHFLEVQEGGGARPRTALEGRLPLAAPDSAYAVIPADEARLDAHGNWSTGERNQRKGGATYFVPRNGGLSPGIFKRKANGDVGIVAIFTSKAPRYEARLGFYEMVAREFAQRLPAQMSRALSKMLARRR